MATLTQISAICTAPEEATKIAEGLRKHKLVASVQLSKVLNFYCSTDDEYIGKEIKITCITLRSLYDSVEAYIKEHHSYIVPQIMSTRIDLASKEFENWVVSQVQAPTGLKYEE